MTANQVYKKGNLSKFIYGDDDKKPDVVAKPEGKPDLSKYSTADEDWYTKDAATISTIYNDKLTIDDLQNVFKAKGYGDVTDTTLDDIVDRYNDDEDMRDRFKDNGISKGKLTKRIKDLKAQLTDYAKGGEISKMSYDEFVETLQPYETEGGFGKTLSKGMKMYYLPTTHPLLNKQFLHQNKRKAYKEYVDYISKEGNEYFRQASFYEKGGEVKKKGNELLIGGITGVLLGIFLNR